MMQSKENQEETNNEKKGNSEALKTEEILSLLSKQNTDFQKESEISSNIHKLYKKIDLVSLAKSRSNQNIENVKEENTDKDLHKKEELIPGSEEENPEELKQEPEKIYTELEAKELAIKNAKEYYNKGFNEGTKKTKEELQKGDHALAVSLKNISDILLQKMPEFSQKLNLSITNLLKNTINEILEYEIDTKSEFFKNKIETLIETITTKINDTEVILSEKDQEIILKYLDSKKISLPYKLSKDDSLQRGDIIVRTGSVEVKEIVEKKLNFHNQRM